LTLVEEEADTWALNSSLFSPFIQPTFHLWSFRFRCILVGDSQ